MDITDTPSSNRLPEHEQDGALVTGEGATPIPDLPDGIVAGDPALALVGALRAVEVAADAGAAALADLVTTATPDLESTPDVESPIPPDASPVVPAAPQE